MAAFCLPLDGPAPPPTAPLLDLSFERDCASVDGVMASEKLVPAYLWAFSSLATSMILMPEFAVV